MKLDELYSRLVDVNPFSLNINMSKVVSEAMLSVYDGLLEQDFDDEEPENCIKLGETREQAEEIKKDLKVVRNNLEKQIEIDNENYRNSFKTRDEAYMYNAKLLRDINKDDGVIISDYGKYPKNYPDFDLESFKSYIYWRTKARKKEYLKAVPSFIYMYLRELCNLVEKETPEEVWGILNEMFDAYSLIEGCTSIIRYINNSMLDFSLLYGKFIKDNDEYLYKAIMKKYEDEIIKFRISKGDFTDTFKYFDKHTSYKITKSRFYSEDYVEIIKKASL